MSEDPKVVKSGLATSELWITVATVAGSIFTALATNLPAEWKMAALICSGLASAAYSISRGLVKK